MNTRTIMVLSGLLVCGAANATIYTWVDSSGVRHYSDIAQNKKAEKVDLSRLQAVQSNGNALEFVRSHAATPQKSTIKSPGHENKKGRENAEPSTP
ncbi:DUF4124 domain-containing protein [Salinisphaera sp. USBA-960]|uniref:DUF4124 domain-containing protein n=1 Tax=Salinisphaera orenii TaxID=856731 RepID=UPI0013A664F8|nr:DUF4124 domain-containing protein [Salifodinibacter halophilus]NNC27069.1 DUF4124 domain-containing protein [Salifodinibacter halophilus]